MRNEGAEAATAASPAGFKGEAILRASKVLSSFSASSPGWTLNELAAATGTPRETLRGILNTLVAHGFLRQDGRGTYRLGYSWLRLGALRRNQFDFRAVALPLMRTIGAAVNETVILSVRVGDQRVHVDYIESAQPVRRVAQIGSSSPLHLGAAGLSLLSTLTQSEVAAYMDRVRPTMSPGALRQVERNLTAIRANGFAVAIGTMNADAAAIAAAARLYTGDSVAITISCPIERFTPELRGTCAELLKSSIAQLSSKLGSNL